MDEKEFTKAFGHAPREPAIDALQRRYQHALMASDGDAKTAMAAVNELLETPITNEDFLALVRGGKK